jgi:curli biogenesis system outer membrane secretion channel CsgG
MLVLPPMAATAQNSPPPMIPIAVVEFTPGANASAMTAEAKRHLQSSLAAELHDSRKFRVYDTRHTRNASAATLVAINTDASTKAAVAVGKTLGVVYVVTGVIVDYSPDAERSHGFTKLQYRMVEVATGKVVYADETMHTGALQLHRKNEAEMHSRVIKPAVDKLAATLVAKF